MVSSARRLALLSALVLSVPAAAAGQGPQCLPLLAQISVRYVACPADFASPLGLCTAGTLRGLGGHVLGTTRFRALTAAPGAGLSPDVVAPTTLSYAGDLELTLPWGVLMVRDVGLSDGAAATFTEMGQVVGGSRGLANTTGNLFVSGSTRPDGFDGTVTGQLCR
jgi:hypothetical protein